MADILQLVASIEWIVLGAVFVFGLMRLNKRVARLYFDLKDIVDDYKDEAWNRREGGE